MVESSNGLTLRLCILWP